MMDRRLFLSIAAMLPAGMALAQDGPPVFTFPSIDGGDLSSADWRGRPVLVVNTASLCGFAGQLRDMQALHEEYGPRGLVVLAVPSDDFNQELENGKAVSEYCTLEFGITLPMTDILHVARGDVHPLYAWAREQTGFVPKWNFAKLLLDPQGRIAGSWGSMTKPGAPQIVQAFSPWLTA